MTQIIALVFVLGLLYGVVGWLVHRAALKKENTNKDLWE
jgi:hypothetical protein